MQFIVLSIYKTLASNGCLNGKISVHPVYHVLSHGINYLRNSAKLAFFKCASYV